jgi:hypothetical protein
MTTGKDGSRWINFCDKPYEILKILYIEDDIRGRGTVVPRVQAKDSTENNILKSLWIDISLWVPFGLEITRHVGENEISTGNEFEVR